jgi:hypothetical protein
MREGGDMISETLPLHSTLGSWYRVKGKTLPCAKAMLAEAFTYRTTTTSENSGN